MEFGEKSIRNVSSSINSNKLTHVRRNINKQKLLTVIDIDQIKNKDIIKLTKQLRDYNSQFKKANK